MLSKKTKYGLQAVIHLARHASKGTILISEMAQKEHIPQKFLEAILLELRKKNVLSSRKGKGGGYLLARPAKEITIGEIIRILEGPLAPVSCVSQTAYKPCDDCSDESCCGIKIVMKKVRDAMADILDSTNLEDVINNVKSAEGKATFNYQI